MSIGSSTSFNFLAPVDDEMHRPLWSVMIPTYNCADYLRETLGSVLEQDPGPEQMQIMVVDDASNDRPEDIVMELGKGRVGFYRQVSNEGHINNFESALNFSRGHLIHLLHGDDRVIWGFYREMEKLFEQLPDISAGFCRHYFIGKDGDQGYITPIIQETGMMSDFFEKMLQENLVQTPSMVVKRSVYEKIGMFDHRFICKEDYEMWLRIGKYFKVGYCKRPLAEYRNYHGSHTTRTINQNWDTMLLLQEIKSSYNEGLVQNLEQIHQQSMATMAWYNIQTLLQMNEPKAASDLMRKTLKLNIPMKQKLRVLKAYFKGLKFRN